MLVLCLLTDCGKRTSKFLRGVLQVTSKVCMSPVTTVAIVTMIHNWLNGIISHSLIHRLFNHAQVGRIQLSDTTKLLSNELQWLKKIRVRIAVVDCPLMLNLFNMLIH